MESSQFHALATLPQEKESPVPIGDRVGPSAGLDAIKREKNLALAGNRTP